LIQTQLEKSRCLLANRSSSRADPELNMVISAFSMDIWNLDFIEIPNIRAKKRFSSPTSTVLTNHGFFSAGPCCFTVQCGCHLPTERILSLLQNEFSIFFDEKDQIAHIKAEFTTGISWHRNLAFRTQLVRAQNFFFHVTYPRSKECKETLISLTESNDLLVRNVGEA
jgi:hypothetical protein